MKNGMLWLLLGTCFSSFALASDLGAQVGRKARLSKIQEPPPVTSNDLPLANPDFEQTGAAGAVPGWQFSQHSGPLSYEMRLVDDVVHSGKYSFRMRRIADQVYGELDQYLEARNLVGKTIEFSAMLRSEAVGPGGWGLVMNFEGSSSPVIPVGILAQARSPGLTGNQDWQRVSVRAKVPAGARVMNVGITLLDAGTGWADDVSLRIVEP